MKLILTISLLISIVQAQSVYHVKNGGSDAADGLTDATAWATVAKVTAMQSSFVPGDSILFKRNSEWNDSLRIFKSGTAANPIVYGAYGTGAKPVITGFTSLTMTDAGSNIWSGTATGSTPTLNTILINGAIGYKATEFPSFHTWQVVQPNLINVIIATTATDYTGKEIAFRSLPWEIDVVKILSQHKGSPNDTLFLDRALTGRGGASTGYWQQNDLSFLTGAGQFVIDSASKLVSVYATSSPTVKYSNIDTLVKIHKQSYITFDNIDLTGANEIAFWCDSGRNIVRKDMSISNNGGLGVVQFDMSGSRFVRDSFQNNLSTGIRLARDTGVVFTDSYINRTGVYPGMGKSGTYLLGGASYTGFYAVPCDNIIFERNKVLNTGYIGGRFRGKQGSIRYNVVDSFCFVKNDGGGFYMNRSASDPSNMDSATRFARNYVRSGFQHLPGNLSNDIVVGVYLDDLTNYVEVDSNTVTSIYFKGFGNKITNNTIFTTVNAIAEGTYNSYHTITGNQIFISNSGTYFLAIGASDSLETIDNNYYSLLPTIDSSYATKIGSSFYKFSQYKSQYPNYDVRTVWGLPSNITSNTPTQFINTSYSDSVIDLSGNWTDIKGKIYRRGIKLQPFESTFLWPSSKTFNDARKAYGRTFLIKNK